MTKTQIVILTILLFLLISLTIDGLNKFILKRKIAKRNYWFLFGSSLIYFLFHCDGHYFAYAADSQRKRYDIPPIERTMELRYRSRFKEEWKNKDTSKIQHSSKFITLGKSIEKETDYFINQKENKTLRIKSTFKMFSSTPKKEFLLFNGIFKDDKFLMHMDSNQRITENQKDSLLMAWELKNQPGITENIMQLADSTKNENGNPKLNASTRKY